MITSYHGAVAAQHAVGQTCLRARLREIAMWVDGIPVAPNRCGRRGRMYSSPHEALVAQGGRQEGELGRPFKQCFR